MALRTPDATVGPYRELNSARLTATVKDDVSIAIPGTDLETMVFTLYSEKRPYSIINARDRVNIKSMVNASGILTLQLDPLDMSIVNGKLTENHRMLIEWTWDGGKYGSYEIRVIVSNVLKVPVVP